MLQAQKKTVVIVTDQRALEMNKKIIEEAVEQGRLKTPIPVISFQDNGKDSALMFLCHDGNPQSPRFDHLIAIERAGMAADGNYYNARKVNIKHLVDPIDKLFIAAQDIPGIATTGLYLTEGQEHRSYGKFITYNIILHFDDLHSRILKEVPLDIVDPLKFPNLQNSPSGLKDSKYNTAIHERPEREN
eukprot:g38768.t1